MLITDDPVEKAFGLWTVGRFSYQREDVKRFATPIPAKGAQGLWDWTPPIDHSLLSPAVVPPKLDTTRLPRGRRPRSFA